MKPWPLHSPARPSTSPTIHILPVVQGAEREVTIPFEPPGRGDRPTDRRLHHHRPRVRLPRPPQVRLGRTQAVCGQDVALVDRYAGVLVRIRPALGRHGVLLSGEGLAEVEIAVLEEGDSVAEDEVNGAVDVAVAVELTLGIDV